MLAAYLLRNVPDRARLVGRGGPACCGPAAAFVIHDYSVAGNTRAKVLWAAVCHGIIIPLAVVKRSDVPLHRYLYTSVRDFDSVDRICERLLAARPGRREAPLLPRLAARPRAHRRRVGAVVIGRTRPLDPRARPAGRVPPAARAPDHVGCRRACRHPPGTSSSSAVASRG